MPEGQIFDVGFGEKSGITEADWIVHVIRRVVVKNNQFINHILNQF